MLKSLPVVICCIAIACQRNEAPSKAKPGHVTTKVVPSDARNARIDTVIQPVPVFIDHALLSNKPETDGTVRQDTTTVARGDTVYLTMWFRESPVGLRSHAVWKDAAKKEIHREDRDMKGGKIATFALATSKLKPGKYHVEGYWGGNVAAEKDFEIAEPKGKK